MAWGFCCVLFSLKKRLLHRTLTYTCSVTSCFLVFMNLHMICMFYLLQFFSVTVRETSFTGLSVVLLFTL